MKNLNVFISSPGDVVQERLIAKKVISELNEIYSKYIHINTIMWEDLPLEATSSFQDGINYFLERQKIDVAVFILWSRLGTTLGNSYLREDGTMYKSGTEYEFDMMFSLWQTTGSPKLMVYVKDAEIQIPKGYTKTQIKDLLEQQEQLQDFIEERFKDRETGTNYAYWQFDKQQSFEERLSTHLNRIVRDRIGENVQIKEWEGNPYVGLRSYEDSESSIFCGRKSLIYDVVEKWQKTGSRTMFVIGESGSGKSSLVKAGIIPHLKTVSVDENEYQVCVHSPSSFNGQIYESLIKVFQQMSDSFNKHLIVYLDQFEEIFSDRLITEEERHRVFDLLCTVSATRMSWIIISMRSDFYGKLVSYPQLALMKGQSYTVDIPSVSASDISEIVEEPARKACLQWEVNDRGESLALQVVKDACEIKDLPLIEFGLSELYNACADNGKLTFEAYERIGKLKGAVAQYADNFYDNLSPEEKESFGYLIGSVITVSNTDNNSFVRKTIHLDDWCSVQPYKSLISKLIDAHLFISDKDATDKATLTIAHEMLFEYWHAVAEWLENRKDFVNKKEHYERLAINWDNNGRKKRDLIVERSSLLEVEYFINRYDKELKGVVQEFLYSSLHTARRKGLTGFIVGLLLTIVLFLSSLSVFLVDDAIADGDISELFSGITLTDVLAIYIPLMLIMIGAILLRLTKKLKYQTIRGTAVFWLLITAFYTIDSIKDFYWASLFYIVPLVVITISSLDELHRRLLWDKNIFRPYLFDDKFEKIKNAVLWSFLGLVLLSTFVALGVAMSEKNERNQRTIQVADELFEALNNISSSMNLNWIDKINLNEKRMNYLEERFWKELLDTVPDTREGEYAICLLNLLRPQEALSYLYPGHYWRDQVVSIVASCLAGEWYYCDILLEDYLQSDRYDDFFWLKTSDLIWVAEKIGRFDLAERIYLMMSDKKIEWFPESNPAMMINYGHVQLSKGDINSAIDSYNKAITDHVEVGGHIDNIKSSIERDFEVFKWRSIISDDILKKASSRIRISPRESFYTSNADTLTTRIMLESLSGGWAMSDSSIVMTFNPLFGLCMYQMFVYNENQEKKEEVFRALTNVRYSKRDNHIYCEEWDQETNVISIGEIVELGDSLVLKIIDNSMTNDQGTTRVYYRIND